MIIKLYKWKIDLVVGITILVIIAGSHVLAMRSAVACRPGAAILMQTGSGTSGYGAVTESTESAGSMGSEAVQRSRGVLKSLGSSQLAYATSNNSGRFGTFNDLKLTNYIAESYTLDTLAPGYEIGWFLNSDESDFVIVALPDETPELQPFLIDSGQTLMRITPLRDERPEEGWLEIIQTEFDALPVNRQYIFVDLPESNDPLRDFDLLLSDDYLSFCINFSPSIITFSDVTMQPEPGYIFLSSSGLYYRAIPDEEIDLLSPY